MVVQLRQKSEDVWKESHKICHWGNTNREKANGKLEKRVKG